MTNKDVLNTRTGQKFNGSTVRLDGTNYLITMKTGITLKVHPFKGSLVLDLILDENYKSHVNGKKGFQLCLTDRYGTLVLSLWKSVLFFLCVVSHYCQALLFVQIYRTFIFNFNLI